jgi:hypothetical protein
MPQKRKYVAAQAQNLKVAREARKRRQSTEPDSEEDNLKETTSDASDEKLEKEGLIETNN